MPKKPPHIPFDLEKYRHQMQKLLQDVAGVELFWSALDFAVYAHDDQWRKSGDAYILHPCSVAKIMVEEMDIDSPEILTAALLHDTVEDVEEVTPERVEAEFGSNVRAIVEGCTKVTHISGDRQTIKKRTHRKLFSGASRKLEVMLVKLADRLHNMRTLEAMPTSKQQRIADETLDIYAPLAGILGLFNMKREMYDLALRHKFPRKGPKVEQRIEELKKSPLGKKVVSKLKKAASAAGIGCMVDIRTKRLWAYYDIRSKLLLHDIETPQEIILLAESPQECYHILGILNSTFPPIPRTIRDFIANPKKTGYQGLHARAIIEGQKFFFKIRTKEMERQAQRGLLRKWIAGSEGEDNALNTILEMFDVMGSEEALSYRDIIAASGSKEVYIYSPKGDLFQFPYGSTVLDFAFSLHTGLGDGCIGATVRGHNVPATYQLRDGEVVRLRCKENMARFSADTVKCCKTARARSALASNFRRRRSKTTILIGCSILTEELARYSLPITCLDDEKIALLREVFPSPLLAVEGSKEEKQRKRESEEEQKKAAREAFYCAVGEGKHRLHKVVEKVLELCGITEYCLIPETDYNHIELTTLDPIVVKLSSCCKPNPAETDNLALLSRMGVSVHRPDCKALQNQPNVREKIVREDLVAVSWDAEKTKIRKEQVYNFYNAERRELFTALAGAPTELRILSFEENVRSGKKKSRSVLSFRVENLALLQRVHNHFAAFDLDIDYTLTV